MNLVVMKFGGTSVQDASAIGRTAEIVRGRVAAGHRAVVVVSALAKVTDQLLAAGAAAGRGDRVEGPGDQQPAAAAASRNCC